MGSQGYANALIVLVSDTVEFSIFNYLIKEILCNLKQVWCIEAIIRHSQIDVTHITITSMPVKDVRGH